MTVYDRILTARGLVGEKRTAFLQPEYAAKHDPFLLPDMQAAVERLVQAHETQEKITIYGDYDIDGLTATTVLLDAFESFGFKDVSAFIPNRFVEGYGLTMDAVERVASTGATLMVTVDCGSLSEKEIIRAGELGLDIIVTDHHNVAPVQPPAVAVINPKRLLQDFPEAYENYILKPEFGVASSGGSDFTPPSPKSDETSAAQAFTDAYSIEARREAVSEDFGGSEATKMADGDDGSGVKNDEANTSKSPDVGNAARNPEQKLYPFLDLAGVGVAFKLVQALQTRLDGLPDGQEKWLLDLVALGTVCDIVTLRDENRTNVYWGLKVLSRTRRPGLKALMAVSGVEQSSVNARHLGFALGPRMNAAGRLETAQFSLDMLRAKDPMEALAAAQKLDDMNVARRSEQEAIFKEALEQAEQFADDPVLVVSAPGWNHGIIGIVAAKLLEKYKKPTYVLEEMGDEAKGSARSYGDFSAADAIRASDDIITKGGGHKLAAGVTLPTKNIAAFRKRVNQFYRDKNLFNQAALLLPTADAEATLPEVNEELISQLAGLEPFGSGNPQPILRTNNLHVRYVRRMGQDAQHVKLELRCPDSGVTMQFLAFNAPKHFFVEPGEIVDVWFQPDVNEWQGRRSVEGRLLHLMSSQ